MSPNACRWVVVGRIAHLCCSTGSVCRYQLAIVLSTVRTRFLRLQLLAALVRLVLVSEPMQAELNERVEALAAARSSRDGAPGDEDDESDWEAGKEAAAAAAPLQATPATSAQLGSTAFGGSEASAAALDEPGSARRSSEPWVLQEFEVSDVPATAPEWAAWLQRRRVGLRRPLGIDLRGRRYWCCGRQAGAFRVYVEENDGQSWGWYEGKWIPHTEMGFVKWTGTQVLFTYCAVFLPYVATGEQIVKLCSWLAAAHAVCEAPLIRALRSAPLPRASNKQRMLAGPELEPLRSDGYRTLVSRLFLSLKMKSRLLSPY